MSFPNVFLFPRNTNFNNIRQADHCHRTWKDLKFARKNIIPSNSRPLTNNTLTTNCSIQSNINNDPSFISQNPIIRYRGSRHPSATRTKCGIDKNGNPNYEEGSYVKYKPNPIKHWRKQLFPDQGIATRSRNSITISQIERPGGRNTLNFKNQDGIIQGYEKDGIGCSRYRQHESFASQLRNMQEYGINSSNDPLCLNDYIDTHSQEKKHCNYTRRSRIRKVTSFTKDFHLQSKSYLQSRVKLYDQNESIKFDSIPKNDVKFNSNYNIFKYQTFSLEDSDKCIYTIPEFNLICNNSNCIERHNPCCDKLNGCSLDKEVEHVVPQRETD